MITPHPLPTRDLLCPQPLDKTALSLDLSVPHIMGILNATPDSFSDGGRYNTLDAALAQCEAMIKAGAAIIDVGGESTRPNASAVAEQDELARVVPIVEAIAARFDVVISVDTSTPAVFDAAYSAGGHIWNDVRALRRDGAVALAAKLDVPVMLMHSRGEPDTMMQMTDYDDVVTDVMKELAERIQNAQEAGVRADNIIVDVGFGFAKTTPQNMTLLRNLTACHALGYPLMIGLSRKRMLADALSAAGLENDVTQRTTMGVVAAVLAYQQGVSIVRTHDVLETAQAVALLHAMSN